MTGNTGPFIQYAHARINSLLAKAGEIQAYSNATLGLEEKELIKVLSQYPSVVKEAGTSYSPALIANYCYELVKAFNHFYQSVPMLIEENKSVRDLRLVISRNVSKVIVDSLLMLGIEAPQKM